MKKTAAKKLVLSYLLLLLTPLLTGIIGHGFLVASSVATGTAAVVIGATGWVVCTGWSFLLMAAGPIGVGLVGLWGL